jgi:hypothetical protein
MKKALITTSLFAILLLLLAPALPAIQCTTVLETDTARFIRQAESMYKNEFQGKIRSIDCLIPKEIKKNFTTSKTVQKIIELLPNVFQDVLEKSLGFLLLCALIVYLIFPFDFIFSIMLVIYSIGMKLYDWPFPDNPGNHHAFRNEKEMIP